METNHDSRSPSSCSKHISLSRLQPAYRHCVFCIIGGPIHAPTFPQKNQKFMRHEVLPADKTRLREKRNRKSTTPTFIPPHPIAKSGESGLALIAFPMFFSPILLFGWSEAFRRVVYLKNRATARGHGPDRFQYIDPGTDGSIQPEKILDWK